jgi:hypothetical protein
VSIEVDASDFFELAADLEAAPAKAIKGVRQALERTSRSIKDDGRKLARKRSGKHARGYPATFSYDLDLNTDGELSSEIGPTIGGQGSLGILEEARGEVEATPQNALRDATRQHTEDLFRGLEKALDDIL